MANLGTSIKKTKGTLKRGKDQLGSAQGYDPKICEVNHSVLRNMAHKDVLVAGIIKKRLDQLKPFTKPSRHSDGRGFRIVNEKGEIDQKCEDYVDFFFNTGWGDPMEHDREDDFSDFVDKLVRDILVIDQIGIEIRRSSSGKVFDFWILDGATIQRANMNNKRVKFVQKIDSTIYDDAKDIYFTADDLIFDYMNKRTDIKHWGYGYAPMEQCIDVITTFLFGMNYNRDIFSKDKIPKGFIKMMGDVDPSTVISVQNYWYQQMSGYGARFKIPVIPSGKDGVGMDFVNLANNAKDMEYAKLMDMIMSLKATVFGIDLLELGIKLDKASQVIGESGQPRLQHSKDSGLSSLVFFVEATCNKILKHIDNKYRFEFVGVKDSDPAKEYAIKKTRLETISTIDELRIEDGLKPFNEDWSKVPLHPQVTPMIQSAQMQAGGEEGAPPSEEEDDEINFDDEDESLETQKSLIKSGTVKSNKIIVV